MDDKYNTPYYAFWRIIHHNYTERDLIAIDVWVAELEYLRNRHDTSY